MKNKLFLVIGLTFLISCNVRFEKRLYNKGYYMNIAAKHNRKTAVQDVTTIKNSLGNSSKSNLQDNHINTQELEIEKEKMVNASLDEKNAMPSSVISSSFNDNPTRTNAMEPNTDRKIVVPSNQKRGKASWDALTGNQLANAKLFMLAAIMGLIVFGAVRAAQKKTIQLSRWANKHKIATKLIIGVLQTACIFTGVEIGKELFDFGYSFSDKVEYISGAITIAGMVGLVLTSKKGNIMPVRQFYLKKLSLVALIMSSFVINVAIGNKIPNQREQISPLGYVAEKMDNSIYKTDRNNQKSDSGIEKNHVKKTKPNHVHSTKGLKKGRGLLGIWIFLYILMALALIIGICALFCVHVYGAAIPLLIVGLAALIIVPIYMAKWHANH